MKHLKFALAFVALITMAVAVDNSTHNDTQTFNGKTYVNSNLFYKPGADDGYYLKCIDSTTGKAKWMKGFTAYTRSIPGAPATVQGFTYVKSLTTANGSGTVIDTLTTDGTSTGTSLFPNHIYSASITPVYNDTVTTAIPFGYVKSIGASNKTITVRVAKGTSLAPASVGTVFYLTVTGD